MSENISKNQQISKTLKETKDRRSKMIIKSYSLKIQNNKISDQLKSNLDRLFLESKWYYNYLLAINNRIYDKYLSKEIYDKLRLDFIEINNNKTNNITKFKFKSKKSEKEFNKLIKDIKNKFYKELNSELKSLEKIKSLNIFNKD
jgi:putative transposase